MQTLDLKQGAPEWHAHRATHFNASDAPAMMGCSPHKTRNQLLHEMHTGIAPTVDAATQRRFDDGHRFESLARSLAEKLIGQDLYPVTGTERRYSASFDGLTMDECTAFEHKTLNDELRFCIRDEFDGYALPKHYQVQMEQQLMVSGADRVLFMATKWDGDTLTEKRHCWYASDPKLRAGIIAGWEQFDADLALYIPPVIAPALVAAAQETLPAVSVKLDGSIAVIDNLEVFGVALTAYIGRINKSPQTDQDFVDLKAVVTTLEKAEAALDAAEASALASIASVNAMQLSVDTFRTLTKTNRLLCDKIYKAENDRRKLEIVQGGKDAAIAYIASQNERLGKPYMPTIAADFAGVAKGLRTLSSMQNAVDTELARFKIEASATADRIHANLTTLRKLDAAHKFLFADVSTIVLKAPDDLTALVNNRIAEHTQIESVRLEKEREQIRQEEADKLAKAAADKAAADIKAEQNAIALETMTALADAKKANNMPAEVLDALENVVTDLIADLTIGRAVSTSANVISIAQRTAPSMAAVTAPSLKLGDINARLGFTVTAEFLKSLGFEASVIVKDAKLYYEYEFNFICDDLIRHIRMAQAKQTEL